MSNERRYTSNCVEENTCRDAPPQQAGAGNTTVTQYLSHCCRLGAAPQQISNWLNYGPNPRRSDQSAIWSNGEDDKK